jgi:hypothetical protein
MRAITFLSTAAILALLARPALAAGDDPLRARMDTGLKLGTERSLLGTEFWVPLTQGRDRVLYTDLRLGSDDQDNFEGNLGFGYRQIVAGAVLGGHGWLDRRHTDLGSTFHQATLGVEALGRDLDARINGYIPLSDDKIYGATGEAAGTPYLLGSGVFYDTNGFRREVPLGGLDLELGVRVPAFTDRVDSIRAYAGAYHFSGDDVEDVTGVRARITADVTPWLALGARFQKDGERGSQGFLEATFRLSGKTSFRTSGLRARLDESPERDIDIVTGTAGTTDGGRQAVLNPAGAPQRVLHVDNAAAPGGDGTLENPYNTLQDAEAAMQPYDVIYVRAGDGTTAGQNQGITIDEPGVSLIGSGVNLVYDGTRVTGAASGSGSVSVLAATTSAPLITNGQVNGDGVTVVDDSAFLSGFTVDGAQRYGVYALSDAGTARIGLFLENLSVTNNGEDGIRAAADGAGSSIEADISSVTARGNKNGVRFYASDDASVTGSLEQSVATANDQHGVIVYDDSTAGAANVDLGGGGRSDGNNVFAGNTLEDLAVDVDGATLTAQNNWWGQATGPDQDDPSIGIRPQIYYGAPVEDGLAAHWTFDAEWTNATTAFDRSGNGHNGTFQGGLSLADQVAATRREGFDFDGGNDFVLTTVNPTALGIVGAAPKTSVVSLNATRFGGAYQTGSFGLGTEYSLWYNGTLWRAQFFANDLDYAAPINAPTMHVQSYDGATVSIYTNGALVTAQPRALNTWPVGDTQIGQWATRYFAGIIDDMRIYNRVLDPPEVSELYRMNTSSAVDTAGFLGSAP